MTIRIPPSSSNSNSSVYTIDFREAAPALASADMYNHDPESARIGGRSVAVPGEVLGLEEAHRRWGRTPWHKLVQPSVELARGWEVDHELAGRLRVSLPCLVVSLPTTHDFQ
jgi:gamma-glutamyltranspeptidase/glutathione hydrolase/leukotriene-C4 hydrolase